MSIMNNYVYGLHHMHFNIVKIVEGLVSFSYVTSRAERSLFYLLSVGKYVQLQPGN